MNSPLVTVAIPTHDNPDGLERTLCCITGQSYKNLEILVSDNGSTDPEVQFVISDFAKNDSRIKPYRQATDTGVDANYRFLVDHATGDYFMFAQDDDWWSDRFIEKLVMRLELDPDAPAGAAPSRYMNETGTQSGLHRLSNISVLNTVGCGDMGFVCMGLWKRQALLDCEVRLPPYVLGGDHITVAHAILAYGDIVIAETERYTKGYARGRFQVCFNNDFWYSFRSWYWLMKTLMNSPQIPARRKLALPVIAITNFARACAITGVQCIVKLPEDNPIRKKVQQRFFGAN